MNTENSSWRETEKTARSCEVGLSVWVPSVLRGQFLQQCRRHWGEAGMGPGPAMRGIFERRGPSWTSWTGLGGSREAGVRERDRGAIGQKRAVNSVFSAACSRLSPVAAGCRRLFSDVFIFLERVCPCGRVPLRQTKSCTGQGVCILRRPLWGRGEAAPVCPALACIAPQGIFFLWNGNRVPPWVVFASDHYHGEAPPAKRLAGACARPPGKTMRIRWILQGVVAAGRFHEGRTEVAERGMEWI
ncbi:MAG: hypothetical protein JWR26_4791 [Pedosphaera sp.]|nr:hypothetical protein [Pedosphaera sp.]